MHKRGQERRTGGVWVPSGEFGWDMVERLDLGVQAADRLDCERLSSECYGWTAVICNPSNINIDLQASEYTTTHSSTLSPQRGCTRSQ